MRTSARSPRAISKFKTTESRECYRMVQEILDLLGRENGRAVTSARLVNKGHALGYCRPLSDDERIAVAHPYVKILSDMTDPNSVHFINNLEEIHTFGREYYYRLRTDVYRNQNGHWRKRAGVALAHPFPKN